MAKTSPTERLTKKVLRLIRKDLGRIEKFKLEHQDELGRRVKKDPPPGMFAGPLASYMRVLVSHKRASEKIEEEWRARLKKMSTADLEAIAAGKPPKKS